MFDTMTLTKATAGVCGAFLVFLLGKWGAEVLYHMDSHGEASYVIEVATAEDAGSDEPEVSFEELMASADAAKGAKVFKKCSACHKLEDGANGTGPHLFGVVGREVASVDGFNALAPAALKLAEAEGLPAHARSVSIRTNSGGSDGR